MQNRFALGFLLLADLDHITADFSLDNKHMPQEVLSKKVLTRF